MHNTPADSRLTLPRSLALLLLSVALALCVAELGLRVAGVTGHEWGWRWSESPYRSITNGQGEQTNQLGLRGRPITYNDDDFVVVIVGDSYTEAGMQPMEDMPEAILEALLQERSGSTKVRVFSVASAGWGQDQQLLALNEYFSHFRANLVLAWLTPVNDFWENTFLDRSVSPAPGRFKPTFWLDAKGQLQGPVEQHSDLRLLELTQRSLYRLSKAPTAALEQHAIERWAAKLPSSYRPPAPAASCPATRIEQNQLVAAFLDGTNTMTAMSTEDVSAGRSHFAPFGLPRSAREQYQIDLTRRLLQEIASRARAQGGEFVAFYPYGSDIDRALSAVRCVQENSSGKLFTLEMTDLLKPLTSPDPGFAFVTPTMQSTVITTVSSADWHLNRHGNELALRGLADELLARGYLKPIGGQGQLPAPHAAQR